jgi:tetratricopeptide (TPR) repeat protein
MRYALGCLLLLGCGTHLPARFVAEQSAAERAYGHGDYRTAAARWHAAAAAAPTAREREEAVYRQAASLERSGDRSAAEAIYAELERGSGERAERAAYARAESAIARGDLSGGYASLRRALVRFPGSGLARHAARRFLEHTAETQGTASELDALERLLSELRGSELEENLTFMRAQWLENAGQTENAREAYLEQATRFPYPRGAFWDDALLAAARLDEGLGRPRTAIAHLERLLRERETARMSGSYERASYAQARFRIAELYRDALGDPKRARLEFRRVWADHPTSRLRDDALFEEALIALRSQDPAGACDAARLLVERESSSRFSVCAHALCPKLSSTAGSCRPYLEARIDTANQPGSGNDDHSSSSR